MSGKLQLLANQLQRILIEHISYFGKIQLLTYRWQRIVIEHILYPVKFSF